VFASATDTSQDVRALERAIAGRYALERELGRGGMGVVMLARDLSLDRPVALKLLPAMLAAQPVLRERFLREARTAAGLSHPHVVPIHAVEAHGDIVFIAMAFVDGETLAERVRRTGPLSPREVARIMREVAWALAYAHGRGIVHRDIKPDNIMIERGSGRVLVTDFGIARPVERSPTTDRLTLEGQLLGTAAFMSPEQGAGEAVDGRSDLYALGGVGFYSLTGHAPFEAPTLEAILVARFTRSAPPVMSVRPDVPLELAAVIDRCLARQPYDRYPSAEAVAEALAESTSAGGARDIAPPVRSFLHAAEQTVLMVTMVIVFTVIYVLPTTRNIGLVLFAIAFGIVMFSIDLVRRARELMREGFDADDVRRAFELERRAHAEEMKQLFDARRMAARRRTRRRAWAAFVVGVALRIALHFWFKARTQVRPPHWWEFVPLVIVELMYSVSLVVAVSSSPKAERRFFRVTASIWRRRFANWFFRMAAIGLGRTGDERPRADMERPAMQLRQLLADGITARFPELPSLVERLERDQDALRVRETEITRAIADAGGARLAAVSDVSGVSEPHVVGEDGRASEFTLRDRRDALLGEMRDALETTRSRRTTTTAALENLRIQLLRIRAGIGSADDMGPEIATLTALVADTRGDAKVASA
jgi:serine/threonine-protein kinase